MPLNPSGRLPVIAAVAVLALAGPPFLGAAAAQSFYPPYYAPPRDAADSPAAQASGTATPVNAVSMRAGPGTNNPVIGTLRRGDRLQVLAIANHGWVQVRAPSGTGWVYGSYLALETGAPLPTNASASPAIPAPAQTDGDSRENESYRQSAAAGDQPPGGTHLPPGAANPALSTPPPLTKPEISSP